MGPRPRGQARRERQGGVRGGRGDRLPRASGDVRGCPPDRSELGRRRSASRGGGGGWQAPHVGGDGVRARVLVGAEQGRMPGVPHRGRGSVGRFVVHQGRFVVGTLRRTRPNDVAKRAKGARERRTVLPDAQANRGDPQGDTNRRRRRRQPSQRRAHRRRGRVRVREQRARPARRRPGFRGRPLALAQTRGPRR